MIHDVRLQVVGLLVLVCTLVAGAQQPNSAAASMTIGGGTGTITIPVRSTPSIDVSGAPNSRFMIVLGLPVIPGNVTLAGEVNIIPQAVILNGFENPVMFNTGPMGSASHIVDIPAVSPVGASVTAQGVVEDANSPFGVTLTAPTTVTLGPAGAQFDAQNLFFLPVVGSHGTLPLIPSAGTMPGDMPEMTQYGDIGPTGVTDPSNFLPVFTNFAPPHLCFTCHGGPPHVWTSYMGTMMANASRDPIFHGAFAVACSDMDYLNSQGLTTMTRHDVADMCIRCHMPSAWQGGRSGVKGDGMASHFAPDVLGADLSLDMEGVVCEVCHRAKGYEASIAPGALDDPGRPENGQLVFSHTTARQGPFPGTVVTSYTGGTTAYGALNPGHFETTQPNVLHLPGFQEGTAVSPAHPTEADPFILDSALCGSCHNVTNPLTGTAEQRTYTEWQNSDYADPASPDFATCTSCHMKRSTGLSQACDILGVNPVYGQYAKYRTDLPDHKFAGANVWVPQLFKVLYPNVDADWNNGSLNYTGIAFFVPNSRDVLWDDITNRAETMMAEAAEVNMTASESSPGVITAQVSVENKTGHKLPSGYPEGRRMWIQVQADDANGVPFYQSGMTDLNNELIIDSDIRIYEMLMGAEWPTIGISRQESLHFVLNNVIVKDNRIQPKGFVQQKGLGGTDSYDPVLAPYPIGGLYPNNHYIDLTNYSITIPPGTARPIKVTASVLHQVASFEYVDFLANGGDALNSTVPAPLAVQVKNLWQSSLPAPLTPVGYIGPTSTPDPSSPYATAMSLVQ